MKNKLLTICRILTGGLFIFSGLVKANDPVGFGIKLEEYYDVFAERWSWTAWLFHSDLMLNTVNLQAAFLTTLEVALGIALLMGLWKNLVSWLLLLLILFFTWLTGYSAITGSVTDCGCFGDFIKLTPLQSFYKDLVLLALILVIFFLRKGLKPIKPLGISIGLFLTVTVFAIWVNVHVLQHDVFLDWRPYAVGDNITENMKLPENAQPDITEMIYAYTNKKSGEQVTLKYLNTELKEKKNLDELLSYSNNKDTWKLDTSYTKIKVKGDRAKIIDFAISDEHDEFITDQILGNPDFALMVVSAGFEHTNKEGWDRISAVQKDAEKEGLFTFALVGEGRTEIEKFRHNQQMAFPFYTADYKVCLTIARVNPNVVLMKEGTIIAKWAWRDLPSFEEIKKTYFPERKPTELIVISNEMFAPGIQVSAKLRDAEEPYNEFFLQDTVGNDLTTALINDTTNAVMFIINELSSDKLTMENWKSILAVMQMTNTAQKPFFVASSGSPEVLGMMKKASGLEFGYYVSDKDVLAKMMETNTGLIVIKNGKVTAKYADGKLPSDSNFLTQ